MKIFSFAILFLCAIHLSYAKDSLYPGEQLFPNQSLVSPSGEFKFGFFTPESPDLRDLPEQSSSYYYIGIWLTSGEPDDQPGLLYDKRGIVWVGNRQNPVFKLLPSVLNLSQNGDLILIQSQKLVWSSNATQAGTCALKLVLLDTGNLVLYDCTFWENVIWQSFDHPTDTWFPSAGLGFTDIIQLSLVSWKDSTDPSPGMYSVEVDQIDQPQKRGFLIREMPNNILYYCTFPAWLSIQDHNGLITFNFTEPSTYTNATPYFQLDSTGILSLIHNYEQIWSTSGGNCESNRRVHLNERKEKLIIGGIFMVIFIASLIFMWIFRRKLSCIKPVSIDYLSVYSYAQIKNATKGFSTKLGEGGFGTVFKGRFFSCIEVAVKKLKIVNQEEKHFRTEVQTLGMIRHTNLVRLLGFCAEGTRRLLIYEYMPNGSLDSHLFVECSNVLSWKNRYKITVGTARGLSYLHQECRDCIIHCDIKPENVLLDRNFSPKLADFGMAKLLNRAFSRALTTMRGTIGYLAPEWISGDAITPKADVYSFGMMLFEIISGKRNAKKLNNRRYPYFPLYAVVKINEGEVLCLLDERLGGNVNVVELIRACKVAGWCIQDSEMRRPSMERVLLMLEGSLSVGIPPVPTSLRNLIDAEDCYSHVSQSILRH